MAKIMVAAMPFTGHVTPMRSMTEALVARGHDVRFYTGSAFRARVEASGARFAAWREATDFDENDLAVTFPRLVGKKGLGQVFKNVEDLFVGTIPGQVADLSDEWAREPWDLLVVENMAAGAALAAEKTDAPWATIAIVPLFIPSRVAPPGGLGLTPGSGPLGRMRDAALRGIRPLLARPLRKPYARARAAAGLEPSAIEFGDAGFSPRLILASGGPSLDFGRPDAPTQLTYVGEVAKLRRAAELPPWWGDLDGRTVVHVTQGTQNIDPGDLIRPTLEALADRDVLVVVATGIAGRDELPFAVPANARVGGILPYADLLPRTDVVVTNGGWGGVLAALGHGIPLLVAGGDLDKPEIAARVAWSGAGVNLKTGTPTTAQVAAGFERVMADSSYRDAAARVGAELTSLGGVAHAAELLEQLLPA